MQRPSGDKPRRGLFTICLAILAWSTCPVTEAAYVQHKPCQDIETSYHIDGLAASVHKSSTEMRIDLDVVGIRPANKSASMFRAEDIIAAIKMSSLWEENTYRLSPEVSSFGNYPHDPQISLSTYKRYRFSYSPEPPGPLDDYLLEIRIQQKENDTLLACSYAYLTPEVNKSLSAASFWIPVLSIALILMASGASRASPSQQDTTIAAMFERYSTSKVADCLSYVQFIFFTGALTLQFPGFVRPITSFSSWSTLMFPGGPISSDSHYHGVFDGIYEVNGTFDGGTKGLEIVSQITGAPATALTWLNIISLACMLLASLSLIFHLGPTIPWTRQVFSSRTMQQIRGTETAGVKSTLYTVLRLFFSYFMTPVAAWTSYQLTYAHLWTVAQTTVSAVILVLIPTAFWWSLRQTPARQLGYFIVVDDSGAHKEGEIRPREQDHLALATFVFMYLRGCIIGGLQIAGMPQLLALAACEALQLLIILLLRRLNALKTTSSFLCAVRLFVWLLCVGFLPDVSGHIPRSVLGIVLLSIHLLVLAFVFILPSSFRLGLSATRMMSKRPTSEQPLELPQISSTATDSERSTSRTVQLWLERVSPSDRASMQSVNDDSASTCTTLVERPRSSDGEPFATPAVHAVSGDPPAAMSGGSAPWVETPNFSRPLSTATRPGHQ